MGHAWSSFHSRRKERADYKRRLRKRLQEAEEYIDVLQTQHQLVSNLLDQQRIPFPYSMPLTWKAYMENKTAKMEEEIRSLKKESLLKKIALDTTEERCNEQNDEVRQLEEDEINLRRQTSDVLREFWDLKIKREADQLSLFQKNDPPDNFSVTSLPNLYFTDL